MEYRSVVALQQSRKAVDISDLLMFSIADSSESRFFATSMELTRTHRDLLLKEGVSPTAFREHELLGALWSYSVRNRRVFGQLRWREPDVRHIVNAQEAVFLCGEAGDAASVSQFDNIIAVYSEPESYSSEPLAENPQQWSTLPGFDGPRRLPERQERRIVIAMGFEPLGLPDLVVQGEFTGVETHLLFPFPTPPDRIRKNWEFARDTVSGTDSFARVSAR